MGIVYHYSTINTKDSGTCSQNFGFVMQMSDCLRQPRRRSCGSCLISPVTRRTSDVKFIGLAPMLCYFLKTRILFLHVVFILFGQTLSPPYNCLSGINGNYVIFASFSSTNAPAVPVFRGCLKKWLVYLGRGVGFEVLPINFPK